MISILKRTFGFIHLHPLAQQHLFSAYLRFFKWQVKSRLNKNLQPVQFIDNIYFLAKKGLTGVTGNIYTGLHEFNDMAFLLHFLRQEDVFFDVGANVGSYTLLASGICHSKTVSFEPIPSTFEILKKNIDFNKLNHLVNIENKGVGGTENNLYFTDGEDTTNHILSEVHGSVPSVLIPMITLDSITCKPNILKIDVEGFETEVLNGAAGILNDLTLKAIIIELNGSGKRYGYNENFIHQKLLAFGFKPYNYHPFERKFEELTSYGSYNTIYLRNIEFVKERVKSASSFKVFSSNI